MMGMRYFTHTRPKMPQAAMKAPFVRPSMERNVPL